ncbi:histidine acid phosphatase [Ostertagia ostertagi]
MGSIALLVLLCSWALAATTVDDGMELLLVQVIWRHGDRSPTKTFPTDPFQDGNWTFGGGGFGQLSPIYVRSTDKNRTIISAMSNLLGMYSQNNSNAIADSDYPAVDGWPTGFVPVAIHTVDATTDYVGIVDVACDRQTHLWEMAKSSPELQEFQNRPDIYVRSTDKNRTIISAMSNLLGMYSQNNSNAIADSDYPAVDGWPTGFVPVAIHTVDATTDYVGIVDVACDRQTHLWEMAKSSPELQEFQNRPDVVDLLTNLTEFCGEPVTIDNVGIIQDALFIELLLDGTLVMNNLDIGNEIQKIRGGSMINDINMHMNIKLQCLNESGSDCKWINGLKYYAYSAHDSTIYAFFSILGIETKVITTHGYPDYSAAVFIELWRNRTDGQPYFKLTYYQNERNATFYPITDFIDLCEGQSFCGLDKFQAFADKTRPDQPMSVWCNVDPRPTGSRSARSISSSRSTGILFLIGIQTQTTLMTTIFAWMNS